MNTAELRIGNYLIHANKVIEVFSVSKDKITFGHPHTGQAIHPTQVKPIPVTKELLLGLGFIFQGTIGKLYGMSAYSEDEQKELYVLTVKDCCACDIILSDNGAGFLISQETGDYGESFYTEPCPYLHDIQNLYYYMNRKQKLAINFFKIPAATL